MKEKHSTYILCAVHICHRRTDLHNNTYKCCIFIVNDPYNIYDYTECSVEKKIVSEIYTFVKFCVV